MFCLAVSFALFGVGLSLKCYTCPEGQSGTCDIEQECSLLENSCLKLTSGEKTYTSCIRHEDCDFMTLSVRFPVPRFTFSCCQSALCNGKKKKGVFSKIMDVFG